MRRFWPVLVVLAACRFDPSGPGVNGTQTNDAAVIDAAVVADAAPGTPDARPGTPDARPGTPDARPTPDAMTTADAMTTVDAGPVVGVACGSSMTCAPGDSCCVTVQQGQPPAYDCNTSCPSGPGHLTYSCDGPEDCPGQDCCLTDQGFGSSCHDQCTGQGTYTTCNTAADCPNGGDKCCPSNVGNIQICRQTCF